MNFSLVAANINPKWVAWGPVQIKRFQGWNANASAVYIQFHQTPPLAGGTTLTAGRVPEFKSFLASAANGFDYEFPNYVRMNELTVALSSTEANYTAVGAGAGLDLTMEFDSLYDVQNGDAVIGDLTTTGSSFTIWSQASTAKRLLRLDLIEQIGAKRFVVVQATDAVHNPSSADFICPITASQSLALNFGIWGLRQQYQPLPTAAVPYIINQGCTIQSFDADGNGNLSQAFTQTAASLVCRAITRVL